MVKNILSFIVGLISGSILNMLIIQISPYIVPPPAGADITTVDGLSKSIHLFTPLHFLFPFLAHALGTFLGALVASFMAKSHQLLLSAIIGIFFLIGGIINAIILPAPIWFEILDLTVAYLPFAYVGYLLYKKRKGR